MASIFPPSPQIGDVFTSNNTTWQWNGEAWIVVPTEGLSFKNITTTPGTQTVVADSGADTLNLIAGENVSITAASASDSITISSTGSYTSVDSVQYPDYIAFDTSPESTSASVGTLAWDTGEGNLSLQITANSNIGIGQELIVLCRNGEATQLNKGEVVRLAGAQGQRPKVMRAYNTGDDGSALTIGIVNENIAAGAEGFIVTQGIVRNINTNGFNEGDILYLSASPGVLSSVKPQAPNHYVFVAVVVKKNAASGRLYVKPQNGYELDELHNVRITSIADGDLIIWNSASSLWLNSPKQNIINTASTAAFLASSSYTNTQISALTTTDIEEGSNLYYTEARGINTASTLFLHNNHENITAEYVSASSQIVLRASGGTPLYGFEGPTMVGQDSQVFYQINSASTQIIAVYQYVNDEWVEITESENNWGYILDENWQWVYDEGSWNLVYQGPALYSASAVTYDSQYVPNLVADIRYLSKLSASATYLPIVTASTLYLLKSGGVINGNLVVNGEFLNSGSVATFNVEHFHLGNNFLSLNTSGNGLGLNAGLEVYRGASPTVKIIWDENTDAWSFTNDGVNYNELGSGGGALIYQPEQPDTTDLDIGTVWIDSDQQVGSGLDIASFRVWNKTLAASATTLSGLDDDGNSLLYVQDLETVYLNGTLLIRDQDYTATSGSSVVLTEAAISGDVVTVHALEDIVFADTYRRSEVDNLLNNIDALPNQSGNSGKFLTTDGTTADWASIVTGSASFFRWRKTYAASATLISGADDNAINLEYTPGLEQVYINGVMIATNEYTATSGSTIMLNDALAVNDVVDIFGYTSVNTTSTYSQAQIDAKYNNLVRWKKAYSASATVISGLDDNSVSLSYTPNYEQVYLNGILLTPITDYARTSASVITLGQAVISGDIIEVIGYAPFNVAEEVLPYSTSTPASPIAGSVWVDSTNPASPLLKVYNGSTWVSVSGGDSGLHPFFTAGI